MVNEAFPKRVDFEHTSDWTAALTRHATAITHDADFPKFESVAPFAAIVIKGGRDNMGPLVSAFVEYEKWRSVR